MPTSAKPPLERLRALLLALLVCGLLGTSVDLLFLKHYESGWQIAPFVLLALGLVASAWTIYAPGRLAVAALRTTMGAFVVAGAIGIVLHAQSNSEFQKELDPALDGSAVMKWSVGLVLCGVLAIGSPVHAQVGRSLGVVDANTAAEKDLLAMPHMTPAIVKGLIERRPFASITDLHAYLLGQKLTPEQTNAFYQKGFVHINLNTATPDEILLVPGAGKRMAREFAEYRPWKTWSQFDKEIGKYVGAERTAQLAQYCFIPVRLNTASDEDILTIPNAGPRMVREFKEYRPWKTKEQFLKEIGKYVGAREAERLWRYTVID